MLFLLFCADLSKKFKSIKAICILKQLKQSKSKSIKTICKDLWYQSKSIKTICKDLDMHFQKMALFIMLWLTVLEKIEFEFEEFC